ncbi:MAG TPA: NUDIX hydrolase [Acidimicrobiia bacterium]
MSDKPEVAVGAVVLRDGELLLVRRGHGPAAGEWSLPGGRVRFGEALREATVRETREETGIDVLVERFLGWVERMGAEPEPYHFVILDFACAPLDPGQAPVAGDDAAGARWVPLEELHGLPLVPGLVEFLVDSGVLHSAASADLASEPPV